MCGSCEALNVMSDNDDIVEAILAVQQQIMENGHNINNQLANLGQLGQIENELERLNSNIEELNEKLED